MRPTIIIFIACALAIANMASAQTESEFAELISNIDSRIQKGLSDYEAFLNAISEEKLGYVSQINALENELVKLRVSERDARQIAQRETVRLDEMTIQIQALDSQAQYSVGVLSEYLNHFESRIHISEDQNFISPLREIRSKLDQAEDTPEARIPIFFEALGAGLARQESLIGGLSFKGEAITPTGGVKIGTIALIGPVAYFHSDDGESTGVLRFNSGTIQPGLNTIASHHASGLKSLATNGSGSVPLDASLGKAFELKEAKGTIPEHIQKGGWVGYAILTLGALAIFISLIKMIDLQSTRLRNPTNLKEIAQSAIAEGQDSALAKASQSHGPIAAIITTGIDFVKADTETLFESMEAVIMKYRPKFERFLPFLATTAAIAPLMGLLGTVVGMIKTFTLIEVFGTGDAKSLSSGISEALVTTELGLIVAIPALIFHGIFSRITRSRISVMEQVASDFSRNISLAKGEEQD